MKLVSLNIWGGRLFEPLMSFIKTQSQDTDIFCFQEVLDTPTNNKLTHEQRANIFSEIMFKLSDFQGIFNPVLTGFDYKDAADFPVDQGLAIFIRKSISVKESGEVYVYKSKNQHTKEDIWKDSFPKSLQYINFTYGDNDYWVVNLHGLWTKDDNDNEARIKQSQIIVDFFQKRTGKKILCGDLNLSPNNKSMELLESGLRNLIKEFKINDTRGPLYKKENKFADYVLVSEDVEVKNFEVPQVKISDHLPLILEFI